jgi:DNA-binding transcriptional ArsR family regulator
MDVFSALADPTRRHIVELLASRGQLSATDISHKFKVTAPAISQHLKVLREAELVDMEKKAQQRIYTLNQKGMTELEEWVKKMGKMWEARFLRLDKLLEIEKRKLNKNKKGLP